MSFHSNSNTNIQYKFCQHILLQVLKTLSKLKNLSGEIFALCVCVELNCLFHLRIFECAFGWKIYKEKMLLIYEKLMKSPWYMLKLVCFSFFPWQFVQLKRIDGIFFSCSYNTGIWVYDMTNYNSLMVLKNIEKNANSIISGIHSISKALAIHSR